jgi:hypothetical protein
MVCQPEDGVEHFAVVRLALEADEFGLEKVDPLSRFRQEIA